MGHAETLNLNNLFRKVFTLEVELMRTSSQNFDGTSEVVDWSDLGRQMWDFLTGRQAAINYEFVEMVVEVPRDTGADAPRATWKVNGTLRVTTDDRESKTLRTA